MEYFPSKEGEENGIYLAFRLDPNAAPWDPFPPQLESPQHRQMLATNELENVEKNA